MTRRGHASVAGAALLLGLPVTAHAHLVTTGLGPVYDGISHLFVSFDDLLAVVAMALLAGLGGSSAGRRALFALPIVWLGGGVAGYLGRVTLLPAGVTSLSLLALGVLAAMNVRLTPWIATTVAAVVGFVHGWLNGVAIALAGREAYGLVGITGAVFVVAALVLGLVVSLRVPWTRIAVRVAGSWIAAIGLLLLGWTLSGRL